MFESSGKLEYGDGWRLVLSIDEELARYYRSQIPRDIKFNIPMYPPHVTVVRGKHETPVNQDLWGKYEGEIVKFKYGHELHMDDTYIWLSVQCFRFEEIRLELGLRRCFDMFKWFHITVANLK